MAACNSRSYLLATEVVTEIVLQKLETLLSHPVCVECLLMQTRTKDAKAKLAMIQGILPTQDGLTMERLGWLLHAMSDTEEFIDKFHLREARKRREALHMAARPFAELVSKYKLWRDLSTLVNKMEKLCGGKFLKEEPEGKRKNEPASSSSSARVPWQGKKLARLTNFWDRQAPTNFVCHTDKKKEIMERIKSKSLTMQGTSIWGSQGTGKTFLARWVYSQAKYMDYECCAWVHISGSMDERKFLLEILKQVSKLAMEMKDMEITDIKKMLQQRSAEAKGFLIVLDDMQLSDQPLVPELVMSIMFCLHVHIITTTQDNTIASFMNTFPAGPIKLENLGDGERQMMLAWKLHREFDGQSLSDEEKSILNMCPGSPLCISLLGGFLSNAGEHKRAALLKDSSMMTLSDVLQLSCNTLPVHLKPCFIYMALFPIVFPIPTRRLVRLWLAEGLLDSYCHDIERKRTRPPEDVGETFILELADRNVIDVVSWRADGSPKACQMLTSPYDMIRPIAISAGFIHIHAAIRNPTGKQQQLPAQLLERTDIRWLTEHTSIVTDSRSGSFPDLYGHVRSFLSFYVKRGILSKDISRFLGKTTSKTAYSLLRVIDLEGVHKPSLQGALHKLVLLRYLGLRATVLDSLPSAVADLHHLETLDIKHTNITSLPSSFWKARSLRHLHLNWFYINLNSILESCSNDVMALTKLQTLSGLVIGEVNENLIRDQMGSSTTLTTLKLFLRRSGGATSGAAGKAVADWISFRLTNLQSLTSGVTKKAELKKEAEPAEEAQPAKVAEPAKEAKHAKEATKEAEPTKEATGVAEPAKEAEGTKETREEAEPAKEDKKDDKPAKKAKPATSQIGPLPELSLAEEHHELLELYLLGQLNKPTWTQLLPVSLRVLTLSGTEVEADMMPQLGGLLRNLRTLRLLANSFRGRSLTFIKDGFPRLENLKLWKLPQLQEVIIESGAMPHLKELEFRHLDRMTNVTGSTIARNWRAYASHPKTMLFSANSRTE
ncbi:hypothetical protein ACJRO7_005261 [Eucalyptus globulus]|uniref:NB-ARC domain-containing protein n=1 Tax=Eucalyptus globulus TaxID=34317 RepID=A0ABD3J555_EUCGL